MKSLLVLLAALGTVLFASSCSSPASDGHTDHQSGATSPAVTGPLPAAFNDADVAFATGMIPHHQQAVAMSALVPTRSTNPAVVKLAADISAAQGPEIEVMKVMLVQWNAGEGPPPGHDDTSGHMGMDGMLDEATMTKLTSLKGAEFDTLWLQSMISHHEGAIKMAQAEVAGGANSDTKDLAKKIAATQEAEITQMKQILGG